MLSFFYKLIGSNEEKIKEKNKALVFTKWINDKLKSNNQEEINSIQDLTSGVKLITLIGLLWGEKNFEFNENPKSPQEKMENFQIIIDFLRIKRKIEIPEYPLQNIVKNKDTTSLLKILWTIIYNHTVKWITLYGVNGENALLHWCSKFSATPINNFTDDWKDGKLLCEILNYYYPNTIDTSFFEINLVLKQLNEKNAPVYIQIKDFQYIDEESIILQCASLYNFFSSLEFLRSDENDNNDQHDLPDFETGTLSQADLDSMDKTQKNIILLLNQHFYPVFPCRKLVQVACINKEGDNLNVDYKYDDFNQAILRAGSRPIIFVSCIGRYQQGKSTIISGITGNLCYNIGNMLHEETKGVFIDGPYELDYFYQRFQIEKRENIYFEGNEILSPVVYFFDIEGYGGIMHGDNIDQNNQAFIQMCTPFLCLSSIFIFLSEPNASQQEIKELFERMKVSSLTTYSNSPDSNGALSLLILFNKYNRVHPSQESYTLENLKRIIKDEENVFKYAWNGATPLRNYGINYEFSMILEALDHFCKDGSFYDIFQLFAEKVIRSIENATEGSFFRCARESINLYNYIVQHYKEPLFDNNIKKLIKEQHENSFSTIADRGYRQSRMKILPRIDQEFEYLSQHLDVEYSYDDLRQKLLNEGTIEINKALEVVKDHPKVFELINNFNGDLNLYIQEKDDKYHKIRSQKIDEVNSQIEQPATNKMANILNQIQQELSNKHYFDYDQNRINECINRFINQLQTFLFQYKDQNNLFLLKDEIIQQVVTNKKSVLEQQILPIIQIEREEEILKLQQEIEVNELITIMINNLYNQHYSNCQSIEILKLRKNLYNVDFYRENYVNTINITNQIQSEILKNMNEVLELLIRNSCNHFRRESEEKRNAIQRLTDKGHVFYQQDNINIIIENNRQNLLDIVNSSFETAKEYLAEHVVELRRVPIPVISVSVETKTTTTYPDGQRVEGEWKQIRTEHRNFSELMSGLGQGFIVVGKFIYDAATAIVQISEAYEMLKNHFNGNNNNNNANQNNNNNANQNNNNNVNQNNNNNANQNNNN